MPTRPLPSALLPENLVSPGFNPASFAETAEVIAKLFDFPEQGLKRVSFDNLVRSGAHRDAAAMLIPDGCRYSSGYIGAGIFAAEVSIFGAGTFTSQAQSEGFALLGALATALKEMKTSSS